MDTQKNLLIVVGEWLEERQRHRSVRVTEKTSSRRLGRWLPSPGSVIFTLVMIGLLLWAQTAGALPLPGDLNAPDAPSTGTIAYQGRLADANGNPLTSTVNMEFRLYNAATGGVYIWEEFWTGANSVQVSDGLFNVMLGSIEPIPQSVVTGNNSLWLGITVGNDDEMLPRVQLGSVPFAVQALTVPDGSVTTNKISDGAVTMSKLASPITSQSWMAYCLTPHTTICGANVVSGYSSTVVGSNQLLQWTLPLAPFPHGLIGSWGKLELADDANVKGSVPIAVVPEGGSLRCYAIVPSGYFNTVNTRVYLTVSGF
jgi:hypothetical protein